MSGSTHCPSEASKFVESKLLGTLCPWTEDLLALFADINVVIVILVVDIEIDIALVDVRLVDFVRFLDAPIILRLIQNWFSGSLVGEQLLLELLLLFLGNVFLQFLHQLFLQLFLMNGAVVAVAD